MLAGDRLREAKRHFVLNGSFSTSPAVSHVHTTLPPGFFAPASHQAHASSTDGSSGCNHRHHEETGFTHATTAASSNDARRPWLYTTPHISGLSNIPRHTMGDSDANSTVTWTVPDSTCGGTPIVPVPPTLVPSPVVVTGIGAGGGMGRGGISTSPPLGFPGARGSTSSSSSSNIHMPVASRGRQNNQVSDMMLYDSYRQQCKMRRQEVECCRKSDAASAGAMRIVSQAAQLSHKINFQSRMYAYLMQRPQGGALSVTGQIGATWVAAAKKEATEAESGGQNRTGSGVQVALGLLKSRFTLKCSSPPPPLPLPPAAAAGAGAAPPPPLPPMCRPPPAAVPQPPLAAAESPFPMEKSTRVAPSARVASDIDGGVPNNTTFSIDSARASTLVYDSHIYRTRQDEKKGVGAASIHQPHSAPSEDSLMDEERHALELLSTVRVLRRQTEDLTVAILHAAGEWGCWKGSGSGLFRGLFVPSKRTELATHEERVLELQLMQIKGANKKNVEQTHPLAMALLRQRPFRRSLPPPPPTSVQAEMFSLQRSHSRVSREGCHDERQQQQQQKKKGVKRTVVDFWRDSCRSLRRPHLQKILLPDDEKDHRMAHEPSTHSELDDYVQKIPPCTSPNLHMAEAAEGPGQGEDQELEPSPSCAVERKRFRSIPSSSSSSSSFSPSSTTRCSQGFNNTEDTGEEGGRNISTSSFSAPSIFNANAAVTVAVAAAALNSDTTLKEEQKSDDEGSTGDASSSTLFGGGAAAAAPQREESTELVQQTVLVTQIELPASATSSATSVHPVFHAEYVCERKPRQRNRLKAIVSRARDYFLWGGVCSSRRGDTADGRRSKKQRDRGAKEK